MCFQCIIFKYQLLSVAQAAIEGFLLVTKNRLLISSSGLKNISVAIYFCRHSKDLILSYNKLNPDFAICCCVHFHPRKRKETMKVSKIFSPLPLLNLILMKLIQLLQMLIKQFWGDISHSMQPVANLIQETSEELSQTLQNY